MTTPNIDFTIGPIVGGAIRYLALPGSTPGAGQSYQLSFQAEFTNNDSVDTLRVNMLSISFPAAVGIGKKDIVISRYIANDQTALDLILTPGQVGRPVDFKATDNFVLTSSPPTTITFKAFVDGNDEPKTRSFDLKKYVAPVAGGAYRWPWRQCDLLRGEYWQGIGANHCCGPQLYAHDLGIRYFDADDKGWTQLLPGLDKTKNENFRVWNKPVFAMADGFVDSFADDILDNPTPPARIDKTPTYGNYFIIDHGGDLMLYAHLKAGTVNGALTATPRAPVRAGDLLGRVGNSGNSDGPHLHIHAIDRATQMLRPIPWSRKMVTAREEGKRARDWRLSEDEGLAAVDTLIYPGDAPPADDQAWREWEDLGGELIFGPAVASWGPQRLDVFGVATDRALYHKWFDGQRWHDWESLGGELTSRPAAVSWGPGRIDVFGRGLNNALFHKWFDGNRWHNWESLGGSLLGAPAVSSRRPNHLDVFVEATDHALYHRIWNGKSWTEWESLGGTLTSDPAATSWGNERIDTFVRATDKTIHHKWWNGSTWSGWESRGRKMKYGPAACSRRTNRLDVFITAPDGALLHQIWNGSQWSHWESLGGLLTEGPAAVSWAEERIDVFGRGADNHLYHTWWRKP